MNKNILFSSIHHSKNLLKNNNKKEKLFSGLLKTNNIFLPNIANKNPSSRGIKNDYFIFGSRINNTPQNNTVNIGFDFSNISKTSNTNYMPLKNKL